MVETSTEVRTVV
jgi:hypothetical protein